MGFNFQRGFPAWRQLSWQNRHTNSQADRPGNGEQTALLLNTLFMPLLPTELSSNVTTWKENTSDNHLPCLSHLYHFSPCSLPWRSQPANSAVWQTGSCEAVKHRLIVCFAVKDSAAASNRNPAEVVHGEKDKAAQHCWGARVLIEKSDQFSETHVWGGERSQFC